MSGVSFFPAQFIPLQFRALFENEFSLSCPLLSCPSKSAVHSFIRDVTNCIPGSLECPHVLSSLLLSLCSCPVPIAQSHELSLDLTHPAELCSVILWGSLPVPGLAVSLHNHHIAFFFNWIFFGFHLTKYAGKLPIEAHINFPHSLLGLPMWLSG